MKKLSLFVSAIFLLLSLESNAFCAPATPLNPALTSLLFDAIYSGDSAEVQKLLNQGADPNAHDSNGSPALFVAADTGQTSESYHPFKTCQLLIQYGASVSLSDEATHLTPLMAAAGTNSLDSVKLFIEHGAALDSIDNAGDTALMKACTSDGTQPEHLSVNTAVYLIDHKAGVNITDGSGDTALMQLAWNGGYQVHSVYIHDSLKIARALLSHGASLNIKDQAGKTALNLAKANHFSQMVKLLKHVKSAKVK